MIGLFLVSHSAGLAAATESLVRQMAGNALRLELAAGSGADGRELGTDASVILARLEKLRDCTAIVVLMDIGSAVLSAEMARDLADEPLREKIHLSPAPFVEGALAAGVAAAAGLPVAVVLAKAASDLAQKQSGLGGAGQAEVPVGEPAAAFVNLKARFDAHILLRCGTRTARGDSLTALTAIGAVGGAAVTVEATGPDAAAAVAALCGLLSQPAVAEIQAAAAAQASSAPVTLSPGSAAGRLFVAKRRRAVIPAGPAPDRTTARARLDLAVAAARARLAGSPILLAQAALLADPAILAPAHERIAREGVNECVAWIETIDDVAGCYATLDDPYLRERARDVREAGDAVLGALLGDGQASIAWPDEPVIALVDELTAAEAASLPLNVLGVLDTGGRTASHATILLRAAGIPALGHVALERIPDSIAFDGATGAIALDPDPAMLTRAAGGVSLGGPGKITLADGTSLEL